MLNFEPPATDAEIRASGLQFVRKVNGMTRPSRESQDVVDRTVDDVAAAVDRLVHSITIKTPSRNREEQARKAHERTRRQFVPA